MFYISLLQSLEVLPTAYTVPHNAWFPHQKSHLPKSHYFYNYTTKMADIDAALADLRLQDKPNITANAKKYHCNRSTLSRRFHGVTKSREDEGDLRRLLNNTQLKVLIKYINDLTKRGLPPTVAIVYNIAAGITQQQPRKN